MKMGLKTGGDSISEAAEEWTQKNGPLSEEERLLFSVMRKSKHNGDGSFTPEEVLKVVKAFGSEQRRIASPPKLVTGFIIGILIYAAAMVGLVVWASSLAKDYSIGSNGAMVNDGTSITTGLTMTKQSLVDLSAATDSDLMSVDSVVLHRPTAGEGWTNHKVSSVQRVDAAHVSISTLDGHSIKIASDKTVEFDNNPVSSSDAASSSVLLKSNTILT
mmetsp:Transcript_72692/g.115076  ORF Transcript_72692/g.115076 Transcript_72692/m.115076 type:complete len:217 (+) Transcript_72692:17-667(+)